MCFVTLVLVFGLAGSAFADNVFWDAGPSGTGTAWNVAANWVGDVAPDNDDYGLIGDPTVSQPIIVNGDNISAGRVVVGQENSGCTLDVMTGGSLTSAAQHFTVGRGSGGGGTLNISGGDVIANAGFVIANYYTNTTGTVNMTGGTLTVHADIASGNWWMQMFTIGDGGVGTFNMDGGAVTVDEDMYLAYHRNDGNSGFLNMTGGTIDVGGTIMLSKSSSISSKIQLDGGIITAGNLLMTANGSLDLAGGTMILDEDRTGRVQEYIDVGLITGYGVQGAVIVDYNDTNPGKTTIVGTVEEPTCQDIIDDGLLIAGDISGPEGTPDCHVDIHDFAFFAGEWLRCNDPQNPECDPYSNPDIFQYIIIDEDVIGHLKVADIDNDGHGDIVLHVHIDKWNIPEPRDTMLAWYQWPNYEKHTIFLGDIIGERFDVGDINGDGSIDIVSAKQINTSGDVQIFWYQNPLPSGNPQDTWQEHLIGNFQGNLKDLRIADIDNDTKADVVARTHGETKIYFQKTGSWSDKTLSHPYKEGLALADLDLDGDIDIILNGFWLETPASPETGTYLQHEIDDKWYTQSTGRWWDNCCSVGVADINQDGILDVILSHSETVGYPLSWYSVDEISKTKTGPWVEHQIVEEFDWCETVDVGDIDNDGDFDVLAAKFERHDTLNEPPYPVSIFYNTSGNGQSWQRLDLAETGIYAGFLGDVGGDGDLDIVGPHSYYTGPLKMWENKCSDHKLSLDRWTYIQVDDARGKWGDWGTPDWLKYFGLDMADVTGDGFKDIVSGRYFYRNPGGNMTGEWPRIDFGINVDGVLFVDVDGDEFGDVIAQALPNVYWLEAADTQANSWGASIIGTLTPTGHTNGQGYILAQLIPGGKPEIIMASGDGTHYFEIPGSPEVGNWPKTRIATGIMDEGIGAGDINGDGYIDIATGKEVGEDYSVWWFENPRNGSSDWLGQLVGPSDHAPDRIVLADMNGDGRMDVVVSEERYPGDDPDANLYWYEQLSGGTFDRHTITTKYSLNNLDVTDFDRDGDMDIVTCEHKGSPERLLIYENDSNGNFEEHVIDSGKESHLGARVADMDNDGDMDIVSIAWDDYQLLHLWRNDSRN